MYNIDDNNKFESQNQRNRIYKVYLGNQSGTA